MTAITCILAILTALTTFLVLIADGSTGQYVNPVFDHNRPDPGVLRLENGTYIAVTTSMDVSKENPNAFPILMSTNLVDWAQQGYVFSGGNLPGWASLQEDSAFWAPEIHTVDGTNYLVYFTARDARTGLLSIGVAVSSGGDPLGVYHDLGHPLVQNVTAGMGVIDPHLFKDTDPNTGKETPYLLWKLDGNGVNFWTPSIIYLRKLNPSGLSFAQEADTVELLRSSLLSWETDVVEAPWMVKMGDFYFLFFSGGSTFWVDYAVSVARSRTIEGPYEDLGSPILRTRWDFLMGFNTSFVSPGHCSVVADRDNNMWMVYHAWKWKHVNKSPGRVLMIDPVQWEFSENNMLWPSVRTGHPSTRRQVAPAETC